jgi:3-oxoacyl-[acyl-carrier protein] reductase
MGKFTGKVAVVTGASKGIGAAISKQLAAEGAAVVVNYSSDAKGAERVVADIVKANGVATAVRANVGFEPDVVALYDVTRKDFGKLDFLVNNAGVFELGPIEGLTADSFNRQFNIKVFGTLLVTKTLLPLFPEAGGSVVNLSSIVSTLAAGGPFEAQMVAMTPLGRVGQPDDIAPVVAFLCSDDARWITGATLLVSGGAGM